jgi:hypothetical protein
MVWRRMLAAETAIACVGGMAFGAVIPGVAHASPAGQETAVPRDGLLPPHVFAPYYFNITDTLAATSKASGAKYLTLAFLQTAKPGSCTVDWNGDPPMPVGKTYAAGIAAVQAAGGNIVASSRAGKSVRHSSTSRRNSAEGSQSDSMIRVPVSSIPDDLPQPRMSTEWGPSGSASTGNADGVGSVLAFDHEEGAADHSGQL